MNKLEQTATAQTQCLSCGTDIVGFSTDGYCEDCLCDNCGTPLTTENEQAVGQCEECEQEEQNE